MARPRFSWTPDARRVAVSPRRFDARLRVLDVASGRVIRGFSLRRRGGVDYLGPHAMSPDGQLVVYGEGTPWFRVRIADVRTGNVRVLMRGAADPAFSRKGHRVAVVTRIVVTGLSDPAAVGLIDLTASPPRVDRRLPPSHSFSSPAVWSTDGSQLAIERDPF